MNNVLLVNTPLTIRLLSETAGGRVPEKPRADATPSPVAAGSRLLQALGFLACPLPQVERLMLTKNPRGQQRTGEQQRAKQARPFRRCRSEHVNRSGKRCRIVTDRIDLWKQGSRALGMELCGALHNFRGRLTPWQSMI